LQPGAFMDFLGNGELPNFHITDGNTKLGTCQDDAPSFASVLGEWHNNRAACCPPGQHVGGRGPPSNSEQPEAATGVLHEVEQRLRDDPEEECRRTGEDRDEDDLRLRSADAARGVARRGLVCV
jgi:hypothetical protein